MLFAFVRGFLRYAEQSCNHYIAFKLLALIRDRVFGALRRLCPAKLEGKDKGDLISVITSDIELLEVFYAHTISPVAIAFLFSLVMVCFIGSYHGGLGILALVAYVTVGVIIPLVTSGLSGDDGIRFRSRSGELSGFVLDSLQIVGINGRSGSGKSTLLISFAVTVMVPLTGIRIHKLASVVFLLLSLIHTVVYRRKLGVKRWLLLATILVSFASGLFGMILDQFPVVLISHRAISIALVFFLAIHIFVFHRKLRKTG